MRVHSKLLIVVTVLGLVLCSFDLASAQQRRKILVAYVAPASLKQYRGLRRKPAFLPSMASTPKLFCSPAAPE